MENKEIFRKKAIDRVSSPEKLNDYIHVTSPSIWVALLGVICILVGAIVWATFGNIYTTVEGAGSVKDGNLVIYIKVADRPSVKEGMDITVSGHKTKVREISPEPVQIGEEVGEYILDAAGMKSGEWVYMVEADTDLADGVYSASITVEAIHPIKFVTN
ncbi:MAG: hypothetical protein IJ198_05155 [Lachnospiraceae bacterium]|nr:hypothetical protein [Lachnospiraceae bacterium]